MCRISVREKDHPDPLNEGEQMWNVGIHPVTGQRTVDNFAFCYHGGTGDEAEPWTVECPHLGDNSRNKISVQHENDAGSVLRFVWHDKTWTSGEGSGCELSEDWHVPDESFTVSGLM
jgi:hypothetical protein